MAEQADSIEGGTSQDLNDALGNLPSFATDGADVLQVLDDQDTAVRQLIRNTGVTFAALNEQEGALRELIVNSENTFDATAQEKEALAETIQIFPTFLRESRLTLDRLEEFSLDTRPLVNDLMPVADDLGPTVRDLGDLSPDLRQLFNDLIPLIDASREGLPAAARFLRGARPVLRAVHTFFPEFNPILAYLNYTREQVAQFLTNGGATIVPGTHLGLENTTGAKGPHGQLPQFGVINSRALALNPTRPEFERGQAYPRPELPQARALVRRGGDLRLPPVRRPAPRPGRCAGARRRGRPAAVPRPARPPLGRQPVPARRGADRSVPERAAQCPEPGRAEAERRHELPRPGRRHRRRERRRRDAEHPLLRHTPLPVARAAAA